MRKSLPLSFPNLWPFKSKKAAPALTSRPFSVAQIEVTSRCNMNCTFCALRSLGSSWINGDLDIQLFRNHIAPHLDLFELVYLQGWGEPLLHPDLWEMARVAKAKGCRTGFTTNGAHLGDYEIEQIFETGINLLSISFAGACPETHTGMRTRSDWDRLLNSITNLSEQKRRLGLNTPWLEIHFLMTCTNLEELPELVRLAANLGADEIVATNLTYTPTKELDDLRAFGPQPPEYAEALYSEAHRLANEYGLKINLYPLGIQDQVMVCDAKPQETVFINQLGEVTPCVLLGLCVQNQIPRYYFGQSKPTPRLRFGHVSEGLLAVLEGRARQDFITAFQRRAACNSPLANLNYLLDQEEVHLPSPPEPCNACYKLCGV